MKAEDFQRLVEQKRQRNPIWFALDADPAADAASIEAAEARMGVRFPDELRVFWREYGGGYFAFTNVFSVDPNSEWNIEVRNEKLSPELRRWFIAISDPGTGDYYGFRVNDGTTVPAVSVFDHDSRTLKETKYGDLFEFLANVGLRP